MPIQDILQGDFRQRDRFKRISQREVVPGAVKSIKMASFIFGSETGSASAAMGNGDNVNIAFTISQNDSFELQGHPYISIYVTSVTAANQLFPAVGGSQDITRWQITGPSFDWHDWNDNLFPRDIEYVTMNIENVSAGSVTILVRSKWRYISPREGGS